MMFSLFIYLGFAKVAESLIEAGADVNNVEVVDGLTPLHLASHDGNSPKVYFSNILFKSF